ncbi:YbaN family protein [Colwellia sp. 1_MG-2023]|uniref:YbaN family protein n=1 Tax=Colwellia sp. 1_MG-2023 TaxID=3062649 RepID=UPI0026E46253|nr:YbaN family protein [Colwellia sp. 1_MG-2023]MDO6446360.1 YbaN family protein [Colwellia sp. 1_MG-2023]
MFLKVVGIFFVGLAGLGVFLPILPTTPFLLVAAGCFAKSSPRLHQKLLDNKTFGPMIYHWQTSRSIPKRAKIISLITMVLGVSYSCWLLDNNYLRILVILLVACPFVFVARLPLSKEDT